MNKQVKQLIKKHNVKNLKELSKKINVSYNIVKNWSSNRTNIDSKGKYNQVKIPQEIDEDIVELVGIILGDGNLNRKQLRIFCNKNEYEYCFYIKSLISNIFKTDGRIYEIKDTNGIKLIINSVKICEYLKSIGLKFGDKIKNKTSIPDWIFENKWYLKRCLRGIFDTDGSFFISSNGTEPNILWKMGYESPLPKEIRRALLLLKYHPTKIFDDRKVALCRKHEVIKFFNEIKPQNNVKLKRYFSCISSIHI